MSFRIDQLAVLNLATVGNSITAGSFVRSGGTSSQFLKADGTVDTNAYITGITSTMVTTALGYTPVPTTRTLTINGVAQDLSADRSWTISAGVSSVTGSGSGISVSPTTGAVVVSNTGVTSNVAGTGISVSGATGAVTITNTGVTSIVAGTAITISGATGAVTINNAGVTSLNGSTGALTGFATQAWVTSQGYLTANQTITLSGEASGSGSTSISVTLGNSAVIGKVLTGLSITGSTITSTDSILTAFGKLQNQVNGLIGGVIYQGTWNASTNSPTLTSSVGTKGYYYVVSVAGSTNLNGVTDWKIGDWAIYNGSAWEKVDNTDAVSSVNGQTGAVVLSTTNIAEGTNLYYTDARARLALSFVAGSGAYNSSTGVITIPTNTNQLTNGAGFITGNQTITLSGDASGSGTTSITVTLANSGVVAGAYNNVTVNAKGLVTSASNVSYLTGNQTITLSGDATGSGATSIAVTLANSGVSAGTYGGNNSIPSLTIDAKGRVTSATTVTPSGTWGISVTGTAGSETLATVTGRGATTSTALTFNGGITIAGQGTGTGIIGNAGFTSNYTGISLNGTLSTSNYNILSSPTEQTLYINRPTGVAIRFREANGADQMVIATGGAVTFSSTITASSLIRSGGTSSQFLKADGSVDSNSYITSASVGNGTLTLAVSGSGLSGSASFTANQSGNTTFTVTSNATNANTASTIVFRDASGNFSAGTITAALSGNATTASTWQTARTLTIGSTGKSVNGSADVSWSLAEIGAPSTTGTGASGTWSINITGSAGSATNSTNTENVASGNISNLNTAWTLPGSSIGNGFRVYRYNAGATGEPVTYDNANWLINIYSHPSGGTASYGHQIAAPDTENIYFRLVTNGTFYSWRALLHSGNYNSYAPTLTGGGASGNWGINITGNADTVDNFHASQSTVANNIVVRDGNGYIFGNYINMTDDGNPGGGTSISSFITKQGDNYYRSVSPTNAMVSIRGVASGSWGINITGSAGSATIASSISGGIPSGTDHYINLRVIRNLNASPTDGMYIGYGNGGAGNTRLFGGGSTGNHAYVDVNGDIWRSSGGYQYVYNTGTWGINISGNSATTSQTNFTTLTLNSATVATQSWVTSQGYITGNQTITLSGDVSGSGTTSISVTVNQIDGWSFVNTGSNSGTAADSINSNGISYVSANISLFGQTDGALYSQAYSSSWQHQIYGDYRTGQIAIRGKNSGTWQSWRTVLDSSNYTSYTLPIGGSWYGINMPGSRWGGYAVSGGEIVFGNGLPNAGQMGMLIDGAYVAGENNGFWSLPSDNNWNGRRGMSWNGTYLDFTTNSPTAQFTTLRLANGFELQQGGSNYGQFNSWVHLPGFHGLYSGQNSAHFYPNNGSYGSWRISGSRNGWNGIEFDASNGQVVLMVNLSSNTTGFHNNSYGWQFFWESGSLYVYKNAYGGGTQATVIDSTTIGSQSVNYANYAQYLSSSNYIIQRGSNGNWNADFQATPAGTMSYGGDLGANGSLGPGGSWWMQQNFRHTNGSNFWGVQVAWGWEDNANRLATRNVTGGSYGGWVYYLNSANFTSYAAPNGGVLTNTFNFQSNLGGYSGSLSGPPLQAYSTSNNSAFFSFHKAGVYAVNMGLDADSVLRIGGWSAAANRWQLDMSGNMTVAGDVTAYSDARVKENIETVEDALDKVLNLRGVYYNRTDSEDKRRKVGVIAQEILEVIPEVVGQDNDGMYNVSYGNIVGVLIEAIKEQQKQIDELKARLD